MDKLPRAGGLIIRIAWKTIPSNFYQIIHQGDHRGAVRSENRYSQTPRERWPSSSAIVRDPLERGSLARNHAGER
jgi:hypothetical protein